MKKFLALALALVMVLALAACGGSATPTATPDPEGSTTPPEGSTTPPEGGAAETVYIGVFEPYTGDSGAGGKKEALGMTYANSLTPTVEIGGVVYNVVLVPADNGSSTDKAPSAAQQLVSSNVSLVLGSYGSGVSMAGSPTFADAGIPVIGVSCTNPQVTIGNSHYFRVCFLDPFQGTVQANFTMQELGAQTAYCLAELGNDYDAGLVHYFTEAFTAAGGTVAASDEFPKDTSDFTTYINNAINSGADIIFCPTSISYATQIIDQAAAQGLTIPLVAGDTWDDNMVLQAATGKDIQVYVSTFYVEGADAEFEAGFKAFINGDSLNLSENGGNDIISAVSVLGYDAYYVALEALKAAGSTDPAAINEALWDITWSGVTGAIAFDQETGDAVRSEAFIKSINTADGSWNFEALQSVS